MHNTSKVSHFHKTPHTRLLELYASDATFRKVYESYGLKEKIIRFLMHMMRIKTCTLRCGRLDNKTGVKFKVVKSQLIDENLWHVEGTLSGKRNVLMEVDKANNVCNVIKKL